MIRTAGRGATFLVGFGGSRAGCFAGTRGVFFGGAFVVALLRGTTFFWGGVFSGQDGAAAAFVPDRRAVCARTCRLLNTIGEVDDQRRTIRGGFDGVVSVAPLPGEAGAPHAPFRAAASLAC